MFKLADMVFTSLKKMGVKNFFRVLWLGMRSPVFSLLTFWATAKTIAISEKEFPGTHSSSGPGNAFRHALWNCLILMYCCKVSSPQKALRWTHKITTIHEEIFSQNSLQTYMDLHNNQVGRDYFMKQLGGIHRQFFETEFFRSPLLEMAREAEFFETVSKEISPEKMVVLER